jgi:autotransporter translocation and assembly factor TamB
MVANILVLAFLVLIIGAAIFFAAGSKKSKGLEWGSKRVNEWAEKEDELVSVGDQKFSLAEGQGRTLSADFPADEVEEKIRQIELEDE